MHIAVCECVCKEDLSVHASAHPSIERILRNWFMLLWRFGESKSLMGEDGMLETQGRVIVQV